MSERKELEKRGGVTGTLLSFLGRLVRLTPVSILSGLTKDAKPDAVPPKVQPCPLCGGSRPFVCAAGVANRGPDIVWRGLPAKPTKRAPGP
jgi:hypothetical protein